MIQSHSVRRAVGAALTFAAMILLVALFTSDSPAVDWPWLQERAHEFYIFKGFLAGGAVLLVILHMEQVWSTEMRTGQRWRYLALFYLTGLISAVSVQQAQNEELKVTPGNLGGLLGAIIVVTAMVISIREARRDKR